MSCIIVIPARMGASRFPGKPLVDLLGKPMVQWVWEASQASQAADHVVVATPDEEIVAACKKFGAEAIITSANHNTGTDRIAEVASKLPADIYVNVQGDEPLIRPSAIAACTQPFNDDASVQMASVFDICPPEEYDNPATVKVVTDLNGDAMYFSRFAIPFPRSERTEPVKKHIGLYAFRGDIVQKFANWKQTPLELAETLEQLRFMENGIKIRMSRAEASECAIDTPEQADLVRTILQQRTSS